MFRLAGSQPTAFTASAISRWPCGMPARAMCSASAPTVILGPGAASRRSPARPRKSRRVWLPRLGAVFRRAEAPKGEGLTARAFFRWAAFDAAEYDVERSGLWTRGLLIRRNIADGDFAFFSTWCPVGTGIETLVMIEGHRSEE